MLTIEVSNLRSQIIGELPVEVIRKIDKKLSFDIPGAYYAQQYNPFAGTRHLFSSANFSFPTGLIHYVLEILKEGGISCHLTDLRPQIVRGSELPLHNLILRPYQITAVDEAVKKQRGIIKAGTGAGKTNIIAGIVAKLNVPTLILIHKTDIFYQLIDRLEAALKIPIGRIGDAECDIKPITVGMVQSVYSAFAGGHNSMKGGKKKFIPDSPEIKAKKLLIQSYITTVNALIVDEAHHVPADTFTIVQKKAINAFYRLGMTASPWREGNDDLLIEAATGKILVDIPSSKLIEMEFLLQPLVQLYEYKHPKKSRAGMKYPEIYDTEVMNNFDRNKMICEIALEAAKKGKTVLIAITKVDHGRILEAMLQPIEKTTLFVFGESESQVRRDVLKELDKRKRKIVICTTIFGEGVDVPNLDVLINAKAGNSSVDAFQLLGRVIRTAPGKKKAYLVDIHDLNCKYLEAHSMARERIYRTEHKYLIKFINSPAELTFDDESW
jgi:superfamily II DNA or RNA helicase